jgi:hypothetical protein
MLEYTLFRGGKPVSQRRRPRRTRNGERVAVSRAFAAAALVEYTGMSQREAARSVGVAPSYVNAAVTIRAAYDPALELDAKLGVIALPEAARSVSALVRLHRAFDNATSADRIAFGRFKGPGTIFDTIVVPAL